MPRFESKRSKRFADDKGRTVTVWSDTIGNRFRARVELKSGVWSPVKEIGWKANEAEACFVLEVYAFTMGWEEVKE